MILAPRAPKRFEHHLPEARAILMIEGPAGDHDMAPTLRCKGAKVVIL